MYYGLRKVFVAHNVPRATKNFRSPWYIMGDEKSRRPFACTRATAQENLSLGQRRRGRGDDFCDDFFRSPYGKGDENWVWATIFVVAQGCFSCSDIYVDAHMYVCVCVYICVDIYICVCVYIIYIDSHMYACVCVCVYIYIYIFVCVYMCIYILYFLKNMYNVILH